MRVSGQRHVLAILPLGTRTVAHGRGGCLGPRTVWTDAQNRAPPPTVFYHSTDQLVVIPYTDCAIPEY